MIYIHMILAILQKKISFTLGRAILVLLLVCSAIFYFKSCKHTSSNSNSKVEIKLQPTTNYIKNGKEHEVIQGKVYTETDFKKFADSLQKTIKGKGKIQTVTYSVVKVDTQVVPQWFYLDTITHTVDVSYTDPFVEVDFTGNTVTKYGHIKFYLQPDTATYIGTLKKRLFHSDIYQVDVHHSNDYFKEISGTGMAIKPPKPLIVFGPGLGVGYNLKSGKIEPYFGIGATLNICSIKQKD